MTDSARAQARASGSTSSTPRIRARVDPSLLHSSGGGSAATSPLTASSSTSTSTPTPTSSTRPRLRSNISTTSSASARSGLSSVSAPGAGAGIGVDGRYARPQSPLRGGAISPGVFGGAARARLTPASTPVAGARVGDNEDVTPTRDQQGPVRPRARVTGSKSAVATPRLGANVMSDRSQVGASGAGSTSRAGVAGPSRPVPLSSASSPSLPFTPSTGAAGPGAGAGLGIGAGAGSGPSGRGSPIPGRARIRATPTTTPSAASSGNGPRPHSPNTGLLRTAASAALTDGHAQQTPTDARLRAVMMASPSAPAVSSPLSPHVGSGLASSSASWTRHAAAGDDAQANEVCSDGVDRDVETDRAPAARVEVGQRGGHREEREPDTAGSQRPIRPSLALPLTPSSASDGRTGPDAAAATTPAIAPATPAQLLSHVHPEHMYTSLSAPSSPLISASTSQSAQIPRLTRDGALSARTHSQTPTLDRRPRGRPHPLLAALSGAASSGSGLGPGGGGGGANGGRPSTPKSPEVHTIALPPLTPSSSRPCYDGIETPRYPHLERRGDRRGAGDGEGEGGVMLGYGGGEGEGDDGGLGLGIIQGLQGLGEPRTAADGDEPRSRAGVEADEIAGNCWEAGQPAGGRGYNDRLSGSTVVGSYDEHKDLYAQGAAHTKEGSNDADAWRYQNGTPNGNRLEIVDLPVSRAESESVDSPAYTGDGQEGEDEEDVLEARINRKVADLEISNASLMAINRSLETTKAKQRAEILRLRRQLRESLHLPASHAGRPLLSPTLTSAAANGNGHTNSFGLSTNDGESTDPYDIDLIGSDDETELDLEIEARWAGMEELVQAMMTKAQDAVARGKEESRPVGRMVLSMGGGENDHGEGDVSLSQADQNGDGVDLGASVASVRTDREGEQGEE